MNRFALARYLAAEILAILDAVADGSYYDANQPWWSGVHEDPGHTNPAYWE